jgi:glyoxylase-like metal-dependent hydrolase (beta-lactamase superfamily II)
MSRARLAAAAALWSLCAGPPALAQAPPAPTPAAQPFRLGAVELVALRDAGFALPNDGKVFGLNASPAEVSKVLVAAGAPPDKIPLSVDALLVKAPGRVVLLDTGLGPSAHGALVASLALAGVSPADVTDVLITHGHGDHVGGLLDAAGKSAFPKATIRMSANEWAWLQGQAQNKALVAAVAPQVKTFEPGQPILPGITPIALYGHTPGHVGYLIVSDGQSLEDIGDTAHSSIISLARPEWTVQFDGDKSVGATRRRAELARLAASHLLVFAPHFPFPGVGHVEAAGDGFTWKPEATAGR